MLRTATPVGPSTIPNSTCIPDVNRPDPLARQRTEVKKIFTGLSMGEEADRIREKAQVQGVYSKRMTGGQTIIMPDEPYFLPIGPVMKPLRAKSKIWNSSVSRER